MPRHDKTGPAGKGQQTGRGFGPCGMGLGWRHRHGMRRGLGRYFKWSWPETEEDEKSALKEYKKALVEELEDVNSELDKKGEK